MICSSGQDLCLSCRFTQDDLQSMDFSAYLASSSDGEEEGSSRDKAACYKVSVG